MILLQKVYIKKTEQQLEFTTPAYLNEMLCLLKTKYNVPIYEAIHFLINKSIDSISFNKNKPYFNFHVINIRNTLLFSIRETDQDIDFKISLKELAELHGEIKEKANL